MYSSFLIFMGYYLVGIIILLTFAPKLAFYEEIATIALGFAGGIASECER